MSDDQIRTLTAGLNELKDGQVRVEERMAERGKQSDALRNWMVALVGALLVQAFAIIFFAGVKSERLDKVVEDVREIKARVYQIHQ